MRFNVLALVVLLPLMMFGCTEEIDPEPAASREQAEPASDPITDYGRQGGGSALGKAKDTARSTAEELQQRSAELGEDLEEPE